jgi:fumarylacetoacetate (FAA) hydrolase family protein
VTTILSIQSSVAYGHVGNSAAVFPLQRLGVEVWPVHTVHFSNHTGYGAWRGPLMPPDDVREVVTGIEERGALPEVDAVLSGYQGGEQIGEVVLDAVARTKAANPDAIYACDPVMGNATSGCFVHPAIPVLLRERVWSQYLEVGIGPDAEIFTKAQPMSAVGTGAEVGIHPRSEWNNPEPEIVLAVDSRGRIAGAALGNDVNLRDFEGRSALLLGKAKDNNGSCAIGPFVRLFDADFTIDDVRGCELAMRVAGPDGFVLEGRSSMARISRDPQDLVGQAIGPNHQYPDGLMLFLGTMFAPTKDRLAPGQGFTHVVGDLVSVATPRCRGCWRRATCRRSRPRA